MSPSHEKNPGPTHISRGNDLGVQSQYFDRFPEEVITNNDLNNFLLKLPLKANRQMYAPMFGKKYPKHELETELRASQTLGEFFAVIDEEIARIGMDDLPKLYRALRARGYSHYDLAG